MNGPPRSGRSWAARAPLSRRLRLVRGQEHLADQITAAAHAGPVDHTLGVLLDRVGRHHQSLGDLGGRVALQHQPGDVPGWVLITAMTVALVMLVWGVASAALRDIITGFLDEVRFN